MQLEAQVRKAVELARGLVDSEYWGALIFPMLVEDLEVYKSALEDERQDEKAIRLAQGASKALRAFEHEVIELSRASGENDER